MKLNEKQKEVTDWIQSPPAPLCLVTGFAGTGKTTTVASALKLKRHKGSKITIAAPTHKALKVLKRKLGVWEHVEYRTVASILHSVPDIGPDGKLRFYSRGLAEDKDTLGDLLIIDESSMIGRAEMAGISALDVPVLFLGDPGQLPPVKESLSKVFEVKPRIDLVEVYRQKGDLVDYLIGLRKSPATLTESTHVSHTSSPDFSMYGKQWVADPDRYRILCWTNAAVESFNNSILSEIYRQEWGFFVGQPVMTGGAVTRRDGKSSKMYIPASTEMIVERVSPVRTIRGFPAVEVYTDLTYDGPLVVIHPGYRGQFEKSLSPLKEEALYWQKLYDAGRRDVDPKRRGCWKLFYQELAVFDDLRACFALTVHRAQGSQYRRGCIHDDIKRAPVALRDKLIYTAASRFSESFSFL